MYIRDEYTNNDSHPGRSGLIVGFLHSDRHFPDVDSNNWMMYKRENHIERRWGVMGILYVPTFSSRRDQTAISTISGGSQVAGRGYKKVESSSVQGSCT